MDASVEDFDEVFYLDKYPDVAQAVRQGHFGSGLAHFRAHGRSEGRQGTHPAIDGAWYLNSYALVQHEIDGGLATSPSDHYRRVGRYRGYLPFRGASRPDNPAPFTSPFGGLWTDLPNAQDLVKGRQEIGLIDDMQAERLTDFIRDGYMIIPGAIPTELVEAARDDLDKAYRGEFSHLLFECLPVVQGIVPYRREFSEAPAKALDIHWDFSSARDVIFAPRVVEMLQLLFEAPVLASQSLGFLRGSAQELHQDSAYVPYTTQRHLAASWVALEDVVAGAGELSYVPGSHRLPDFKYAEKRKSVAEMQRHGASDDAISQDIRRHVRDLATMARSDGFREQTFLARKGDVLIWHADLAHGGRPISAQQTRKSIVTHYCSKYSTPLFCENNHLEMRHHGRCAYVSSHYGYVREKRSSSDTAPAVP